jgi:hypothetical protein
MSSTDSRRALLVAALGFARLELRPEPPALAVLKGWLGSWRGIGAIAEGMHRQGFDLSLTQYDERGWRATFYVSGMEHAPTGATGSAWEATPTRAVQRAAWQALTKGGNG